MNLSKKQKLSKFLSQKINLIEKYEISNTYLSIFSIGLVSSMTALSNASSIPMVMVYVSALGINLAALTSVLNYRLEKLSEKNNASNVESELNC